MNLFNFRRDDSKEIIVIGCGRLGGALATALSEQGQTVTIIDRKKDSFRKLAASFGGITVLGDATDIEILQSVNINKDSIVLCVTEDGNTNIMAAQMAKFMFNAGRVIVRLYDPDKASVFKGQNIETISPAKLMVKEIDNMLNLPFNEEEYVEGEEI